MVGLGDDIQFQIPMRGNEFSALAVCLASLLSFQIPMRGNEQWARGDFYGQPDVPDPHEG